MKKNNKFIIKKEKSYEITKSYDEINRGRKRPKPRIVWRGIIEGSVGLIAGVAKAGKTTFAENLAISLAVGKESFFNSKMDGIPRKVLFVNLEESAWIRSFRNDKQIQRLSEEELKLYQNNYFTIPENFPEYLNTKEDWELLNEYILAVNPDVIFLDSLSHMCIGEIEKSHVAQQFMQTFKKYVVSTKKTVVVIHHNVKGNDKPMDEHSMAGSRFVPQTFQYAYGFGNIPRGGNYMCNLNNKFFLEDKITATLYQISSDNWLEPLGTKNKFELYEKSGKVDYRCDSTNTDLVYNYFVKTTKAKSKASQGSQDKTVITTKELMKNFVQSSSDDFSKETLHQLLHKLQDLNKIIRLEKGKYKIVNDAEKEEAKQ